MGGLFGKPAASLPKPAPPAFSPDYSQAKFDGNYVNQLAAQASQTLAATQAAAQAEASKQAAAIMAASGTATWYKYLYYLFGLAFLVALAIVLYDTFAPDTWPNIFFNKSRNGPSSGGAPPPVPSSQILYIGYARYGTDNVTNYSDVTRYVSSLIQNQVSLPGFTVSVANVGLTTDPYPAKLKTLYIQYYTGTTDYKYVTKADGEAVPTLPEASPSTPPESVEAPAPPILSKIYSTIFGNSSGDLAPSFHDATTSASVKGNLAPLSAERDGGYGMQWWMYVKDWNYGYGKKKAVVKRPDATNSGIANPSISLHPTDNAMQISVSIYPSTEGGSGKAEPAPAGHSGSSDDVFVCDIPNIPLQTWFSVSVTVFGRNLDVYLDGKLVKSCFLSGVPKPAVGDIQLTPEGGFSGRICNFYHYPKMLTPSDAMTFWSAGTKCRNQTTTGKSSATGYSVKFGVYDNLGKEVQEYAF
jgi:hypothetical protein